MSDDYAAPPPQPVTIYERDPRPVLYDHDAKPLTRPIGFPRPTPKPSRV